MDNYWVFVDETKNNLKELEHFRTFSCSRCGTDIRHHILDVYAVCPNCGLETKVWIHGTKGTEIQEIINAVLEWIGTGENFTAVLKKYSIIQKEIEEDKELENE